MCLVKFVKLLLFLLIFDVDEFKVKFGVFRFYNKKGRLILYL